MSDTYRQLFHDDYKYNSEKLWISDDLSIILSTICLINHVVQLMGFVSS